MTTEEKTALIMERLPGARYSNISPSVRVNALTMALVAFSQRKGQALSERAADLTASALDAEVERYFGRELAFDEVLLALDWGMHREFGDFSGMNVDRMFDFVRQYRNSPERRDAITRMKSPGNPSRRTAEEDVGRLNWESAMRYTRRAWREWREKAAEDSEGMFAGALAVARRVLMANSYRWLKSEGVVALDSATIALEGRARRSAAEKLGKNCNPSVVENYAMQACLLEVFRLCDREGFDLMGALDELEKNVPPGDRRFYTG